MIIAATLYQRTFLSCCPFSCERERKDTHHFLSSKHSAKIFSLDVVRDFNSVPFLVWKGGANVQPFIFPTTQIEKIFFERVVQRVKLCGLARLQSGRKDTTDF